MENNIKNYQDDFDFLLKLYSAVVDKDGNEVKGSRRKLGWPDYDWSATMWTNSKANAYTASCIDGKCVNCYNDNGEIHIVVNDHHMGPGAVRLQFIAELPREIYPDGLQRNVIPEPVNIELIIGKGDLPTEMEVEMLLPYIKGEPFTYEDFTPEQIEELQRPATEAAGKLDDFVRTASEAESVREANEKRRVRMENKIGEAEQGRQTSEVVRSTAEKERIKAEADREEAETKRALAEETRVSDENTRKSNETTRETNETTRGINEEARKTAETTRGTNESTRQTNEEVRKTAETTRGANEEARKTAEQTRQANETTRGTNETTRQTQEQTRQTQESARQTAEQSRATEFAGFSNAIAAKLDKSVWDAKNKQFNSSGYYSGSDGTSHASPSFFRTDLILINRDYDIIVRTWGYITTAALVLFSADGKIISQTPHGGSGVQLEKNLTLAAADIPAEAVYFASCTHKDFTAQSFWSNGDALEARENAVAGALCSTVKPIQETLAELELAKSNYCVGEWDPEILAPEAKAMYGDQSLMDFRFMLADTSVETNGQPVEAAKELNPLNFLRYKDGSYAPTVVITAAMKAACDVALYLDSAATQQYCEAGAFDPVAFYENKPWGTKLYTADGTEVEHILRPWETTETKYTIGGGFGTDTYLLDQKKGKSGRTWKGIFTSPVTWDGIEVNTPLPPTMLSLSPYTTFGNEARCIFALTTDSDYCKSGAAVNNLHSAFVDGRAYPRVSDVNYITAMTHCRAMNAESSPTFPYAEGGFLTLNTIISALELLNGTKNLTNIYGSGISSNHTCNNEADWLEHGGVKYRVKGETTWKYKYHAGAVEGIHKDANATNTHVYELTNNEYPKEHCMESHMAYSFAKERGIPENQEFDFYGYTYKYKRQAGMRADRMDAIVYRVVTVESDGFDDSGNAIRFEIQINLRMSLYNGFNLSGDIFRNCPGGYEQILHIDHDPTIDHMNFPEKVYIEPDQKKWHSETAYVKADGSPFSFESDYQLIHEGLSLGNNYVRKRLSGAAKPLTQGGGLYTGECYFYYGLFYSADATYIGKWFRRGLRFGGSANHGNCAPRYVNGYYYAAATFRYYACLAQFVVSARALQAQESTPQA